MAKKTIDFVYIAGNCPSDGCPEYTFNHKFYFDNAYARQAFVKARHIIDKYILTGTDIPDASPLRTQDEISDFVAKIQELIPGSEDVLTISSCKHGRILYQRAVRFKNVDDINDLARKIKIALPDLEKGKNRPIESYFLNV